MILSFAKTLKKHNINYQQELLVEAIDISDICAYMTYIQLSLYGIPAIVYCGDALSKKVKFRLETPLYFMQYWKFRTYNSKNTDENSNNIDNNTQKIIIKQPVLDTNLFKEVTVKGNTQISLW